MTYSSNSGDVHDNSGLESLLLTSKYRWNRNFATEVNLGSGLSDDVFPYGGDGIQFGINVPMGVSIGPGSLVGEVGYTSTDGNVSDTTSWDGYVNYGIGYAYELTRSVSLKMEFAGHGATIEQTGGTSTEDHLAFIVTPAIELDLKSNIKPSLTLGLADGSPSFALGLNYTMTFGQIQDRRVRLREGKDKSVLQQAQALKRKARKAFRKGNLKEAIQFYERALTYEPEDVELLSNLGSLHYREGNYEEARSYYRQALEVNPSDQLSRLFLGITYDQLGNTEQARKQLRKTRSVNPNSRLGKKAQAWLKRIRGE